MMKVLLLLALSTRGRPVVHRGTTAAGYKWRLARRPDLAAGIGLPDHPWLLLLLADVTVPGGARQCIAGVGGFKTKAEALAGVAGIDQREETMEQLFPGLQFEPPTCSWSGAASGVLF